MKRRGVLCSRGLVIILLIILSTAFSNIEVKAETVDDLRAYLGYTVEKRKPVMIDSIINKKSSVTETSNANKELEKLSSNLKQFENKYKQSLSSNVKALALVELMDTIKDLKSMIKEQQLIVNSITTVDVDKLISDTKASELEIEQKKLLGSYNFDIGSIGDSAISPVTQLKLVTPYGYKLNADGSHESKNSGIDLQIIKDANVYAQWNGKVAYIEDDTEVEGSKVVTIFHGQRLYSVYHHIKPGEIYVGKEVYQGSAIGKSVDTQKFEKSKNNHIGYQIILDDKFINPLLVFGHQGKQLYESWLKSGYEVYTVEEGEEFYYTDSLSKDNPNNFKGEVNTIKDAAEVKGNYILPDPGTVK